MTGLPLLDPNCFPAMLICMALLTITLVLPLPLEVKVLLLFLDHVVAVEAVCPHCKDTIVPTHTPTTCPLIIEINIMQTSLPRRRSAPRRRSPTP
jgi:hypothetical protein